MPFYELNLELISWISRSNLEYPLYIFIMLMNIALILNIGALIIIYRRKTKKTISGMKLIIVTINLILLMVVPGLYFVDIVLSGATISE